jgi:hypothetical protein
MARVDGAIKSLGLGVSTLHEFKQTQPFAKEQINFRADSVKGLTRRQSSEWIGITGEVSDLLINYDTDNVLQLTVNNIEYWAIFRPQRTTWLLLDTNGVSHPTRYTEAAKQYLDLAEAGEISHATTSDITFVANRHVQPLIDELTLRPNTDTSMIHVKISANVPVTITWQTGGTVEAPTYSTISYVAVSSKSVVEQASEIAALMIPLSTSQTVLQENSTVAVTVNDGATWAGYSNISITGTDNYAAINGFVNDTSDLPNTAPLNEIVAVVPQGSTDASYYLRAEGQEGEEYIPPPVDETFNTQLTVQGSPDRGFELKNTPSYVETHDSRGYIIDQFHLNYLFDGFAFEWTDGTTLLTDTDYASGVTVLGLSHFWRDYYDGNNVVQSVEFYVQFTAQPAAEDVPVHMAFTTLQGQTYSGAVYKSADYRGIITYVLDYSAAAFQSGDYPVSVVITRAGAANAVTPAAIAQPLIPGVVWREISAPHEPYQLDASTMPHVIFYNKEDSIWDFSRVGASGYAFWTPRVAGSAATNPFVLDRPIKDLSIFQGRLLAAVGPYIAMTQTDSVLNFFRQTHAGGILATDPIHVGSTINNEIDFEYVVPHNGAVVAFNSSGQFQLPSSNAVTPSNAALPMTSGYPYTAKCRPTSNGVSLYFPNSSGTASDVHELSIDANRDSFETARPLTNQIPNYIQGDVNHITVDTLLNLIAVHSADRKRVYVADISVEPNGYRVHSWSQWAFEAPVVESRRKGAKLQLLGENNGNVTLIDVAQRTVQGVPLEDIRLDYVTRHTFAEPTTVIDLPVDLPVNYPRTYVVIAGEDTDKPGEPLANTFDLEGVLTLDEPIVGTVIVGMFFLSAFTPGKVHVRDASGYIQRGAKLRILRYECILEDTGYLAAHIVTPHYTFPVQEYYGTLNSQMQYNDVNINDNFFQIPFKQDSTLADIRLFTADHTPATIVGMEYAGGYNKRGRRF